MILGERLGQEGPQRQGGSVNVAFVLGEVGSGVGEGLLDRRLRQRLGERQVVPLHEGGEDQTETPWQATAG